MNPENLKKANDTSEVRLKGNFCARGLVMGWYITACKLIGLQASPVDGLEGEYFEIFIWVDSNRCMVYYVPVTIHGIILASMVQNSYKEKPQEEVFPLPDLKRFLERKLEEQRNKLATCISDASSWYVA